VRELAAEDTMGALNPQLEREILDAVRGIRYGSVEVVVHDAKVVQVVRTEKVRFDVRPPTGSGRTGTTD
jgi:hypothetical protein